MTRSPLVTDLLRSAQDFSCSALRADREDRLPIFLLHAATGVEHLAKAVLANKDPSLISASDFESLLHATGLHEYARRPPHLRKTISMKEALDRCEHFAPSLRSLRQDLESLQDIRNGVVHLGYVPTEITGRLLTSCVKACHVLLKEVAESPTSFWGSLHADVMALLDREHEALDERVRRTLGDARRAFEERFSRMDPSWRAEVINLIVSSYDAASIDRQLRACPACGSPAAVEGWLEPDWNVDFEKSDGEVYAVGASLNGVSFAPKEMDCRACGLRLSGPEELGSAGVETSWELEDADAGLVEEWERDFWADFYP